MPDQEVFKSIFSKNKMDISKDIDIFIEIITKILQKDKNNANKKELLKIKNAKTQVAKKIIKINNLIKEYTHHNFDKLSQEIIDLIYEISKNKFSYESLKKKINYLFKGYNGLGTSYIVFRKK